MVSRNANSWLQLRSGMYWDTARQSWARGGRGGVRVKEQQRPSPESRARRGRRWDAGQWGLWSISVFGRHCFGFGRCGSIKKATFPHADTSESRRAEVANARLKVLQLQPDKCCEGGGVVLPCTTVRRSNLDLAAYVHRIRWQGISQPLCSPLWHLSSQILVRFFFFFSLHPARGWNAIELYHWAGKANLHKASCRVYQRELQQCKVNCTSSFSLQETRPDSHLIGICLSQPGEQAVPTGVSHIN